MRIADDNDNPLEEIRSEQNKKNEEYKALDEMLHNQEIYNISYAILPDCYATRLYDFLLKLAKLEALKSGESENHRLLKIRDMVSKLERVPSVQKHIWATETPEDEEINNIVSLVEERQKMRKMGPVHRYVYKKIKEKRSKR